MYTLVKDTGQIAKVTVIAFYMKQRVQFDVMKHHTVLDTFSSNG